MNFSVYELLWLAFCYSFFGWIAETVAATVKKKKFVNRGFFSGPFCFVYGIAAVLMTETLWELKDRWFFLFLGCMIQATLIEWLTGKILERINSKKWWDYSDKRWNFDGYICAQYSVLWGILGFVVVKFGNQLLAAVYDFIPSLIGHIFIWCLLAAAVLDMGASLLAAFHIENDAAFVREWNHKVTQLTARFGNWIVSHVGKRMVKAYPALDAKIKKERAVNERFAEGCCFYKLFLLFFIGCVLGDFTETIFCRITAGVWMSRSSLVWGPFSIVWGIAMAMATALLYKDRDKPDRHLFMIGAFLGGAYEYICSVFTEIVFGKVFWDYSHIPFNLGGRINLLYCFFWGIAAVVWIKGVYPVMSKWIEKIPVRTGTVVTWMLVVFMIVNIVVSMAALIRYDARAKGQTAQYGWEQTIDEHFNDQRMEKIYPNAISR